MYQDYTPGKCRCCCGKDVEWVFEVLLEGGTSFFKFLHSGDPLSLKHCLCVNSVLTNRREKCKCMVVFLRGCLHDTGATFAPRRVHSGSLSWLYVCLHDTATKSYASASHPGVSSLRLSHRGENFTPVRNLATVSCKHETTTRFGVISV